MSHKLLFTFLFLFPSVCMDKTRRLQCLQPYFGNRGTDKHSADSGSQSWMTAEYSGQQSSWQTQPPWAAQLHMALAAQKVEPTAWPEAAAAAWLEATVAVQTILTLQPLIAQLVVARL